MNFIDYLDWRGDITFAEKDLNEVDNLIFSELAYTEMNGLPAEGDEGMTISALWDALEDSDTSVYGANIPLPMLKAAAKSARFRDVKVRWYVSKIDHEKHSQFSASTFFYAEDKAYVAFRGTDGTLVGWREDFNMSFLDETAGQNAAVRYLDRIGTLTDARLTVGGHSKGGNFAVYAAAFCDPKLRESRIDRIFSNDGPGFKREVAGSEQLRAILPHVVKIIPDSSIVGILLAGDEKRQYIRSSVKGFAQHDPYTWSVLGTAFVPSDTRSTLSTFMEETLSAWLSGLEPAQRKTFVDVFFDSVNATGAVTLSQLNENKLAAYGAFMKALAGIDSEQKQELQQILKRLIASGIDAVWSGNKES